MHCKCEWKEIEKMDGCVYRCVNKKVVNVNDGEGSI